MSRAADLRILSYNLHVGIAIGALRWAMRPRRKGRATRADIVCVQEAQTRRAKIALRAVFPKGVWLWLGPSMGSPAGTIVLARRRRFTLCGKYNRKVTDGPAQGALPARFLSGGVLVDKVTGRVVDVTSVHTWAMGKGLAKADNRVREQHQRQVERVAEQHVSGSGITDYDVLDVAAGDWNEDPLFDDGSPVTARREMRKTAGMVPTATVTRTGDRDAKLDEVFVRKQPWLTVKSRTRVYPSGPGTEREHPITFVVLHVEPVADAFRFTPGVESNAQRVVKARLAA